MKNTKATNKEGPFERGPVARVYHTEKTPCAGKPLRFWRLINGKEKSSWHALDELDTINATARKMNESAQTHGEDFAIPTRDEINAARIYRNFCEAQKKIGKSVPLLSDIVAYVLAREQDRHDATPTISEVAAEYIADKQRAKKLSSVHIKSLTQIFKFFSENFKDKKLADFTVDAVTKAIESKPELKNPNSQRAYYSNIRALFSWWYRHENKSRRPAERLTNPLENLDVPKLQKTEKPKPISSETLRRYLNLVHEKKPELLPAVVVQAFCGLRRTDVMKLKWSDIVGGFVFLTPEILGEDNFHAVPLPPCAMAWLELTESKDPDEFIAFPELTGRDRIEKALTAKTNFDATYARISTSPASGGATGRFIASERSSRTAIAVGPEPVGLGSFSHTLQSNLWETPSHRDGVGHASRLPRDTLRHSAIINLSVLFGDIRTAQICKLDSRTSNNYRDVVATLKPTTATVQARAWFSVYPPEVPLEDKHLEKFQARVYAADALYRRRSTPWYFVALKFFCRAFIDENIDIYRLSPIDLVGIGGGSLANPSSGSYEFSLTYLAENYEKQKEINAAITRVAESLKKEGLLEIIETPADEKAPPLFTFRASQILTA